MYSQHIWNMINCWITCQIINPYAPGLIWKSHFLSNE
jgi:hypothetical protein